MWALSLLLLLVGIGLLIGGVRLWRRGRWWPKAAAMAVLLPAIAVLAAGAVHLWYYHRPLPASVEARPLFQGVTYWREVHRDPRPMVVHIVRIDLDAPGIGLFVTPGQRRSGRSMPARTVTQFVDEFNVQLAINAAFFAPVRKDGEPKRYPGPGGAVIPLGLAASRGEAYSPARRDYAELHISKDNVAQLLPGGRGLAGPGYDAVSGKGLFLVEGKVVQVASAGPVFREPSPRTAVALSDDGRVMWWAAVDGRQPSYSEGITLPELATILLRHGADTALNLDGGGSTALAMAGRAGGARVLNWPVHGRFPPGRQRAVANHLGLFAQPLAP